MQAANLAIVAPSRASLGEMSRLRHPGAVLRDRFRDAGIYLQNGTTP
jgi:hypothetical protein